MESGFVGDLLEFETSATGLESGDYAGYVVGYQTKSSVLSVFFNDYIGDSGTSS